MEASFIIGFHTRRFDNLLQTLRFLTFNHNEVIEKCQLVTVCQDEVSQEQLLKVSLPCFDCDSEAITHFEQYASNFGQWVHFDLNEPCMKLPKITNFGIEKSKSKKLIILESDRILPSGYFAKTLAELKEGVQITTKNMVKLAQPTMDEEIIDDIFDYVDEHRSETNEIGMRNMWSGNTAIMRSDFEKAGKMDEDYIGYGWADSDMTRQMESIGVKSIFRPEIELHLWHESATYGDGNQKKMFLENGKKFLSKWNLAPPQWFIEEIEMYMPEKRLG